MQHVKILLTLSIHVEEGMFETKVSHLRVLNAQSFRGFHSMGPHQNRPQSP